ncbi:MAG: hypothetical protein WAX07_00810 [Candidatus Altiarchaeia archaeon]
MNKIKIPTSLSARVVYFLAAVFAVVVYVLWRTHRDDLTMIVLDLGLISALIATIMYPLFCSQ